VCESLYMSVHLNGNLSVCGGLINYLVACACVFVIACRVGKRKV
jgi:hypothetical protein